MRSLLFSLGCLLGAGTLTSASAQQLICQRTFSTPGTAGTPNTRLYGNVTAVSADSAVLLLGTSASGFNSGRSRAALVWVKRGQCDTLSLRTVGSGSYSYYSPAYVLNTRRKQVRVLTTQLNSTSPNTAQLWQFSRKGQVQGQYNYALASLGIPRGLLEAPDEGTYLSIQADAGASRAALLKVNDQGQLQWQRTYSSRSNNLGTKIFDFNRPCYTVRGNLLLAGSVIRTAAGVGEQYGQIIEVNQQGDSITSRTLFRGRLNTATCIQEACPLRDGGFLLLTRLDSTNSRTCGFTRLDANFNEVWTRFYRPAGKQVNPMQGEGQVLELADGTLLGMVSLGSATNSANLDTRLLRLSAAGQIMQEYVVPGAVLSAQSLTPLAADSSFLLNGSTSAGNTLVQFRLPGLRRVVAAPTIPAAQPLATRATTATWPAPAYPNPATTSVTVPLPALAAEARLTLTDLLGRRVRALAVAAGTGAAVLDVGGLAPGVYLLTLERVGQAAAVQRLTVTGP